MVATYDDATAFDAIHDQTRAGSYIEADREHPLGLFLYTMSLMHGLPVGLVDGGTGLGLMWGRERAVALRKAAEIDDVLVTPIPPDAFNLHDFFRNRLTYAFDRITGVSSSPPSGAITWAIFL